MSRKKPLPERMAKPLEQPEVRVVCAAVEQDRPMIRKVLWIREWTKTWTDRLEALHRTKVATPEWVAPLTNCVRLLARLEQFSAKDNPLDEDLKATRRGLQVLAGVMERRIIVRYLMEGEYLGPGLPRLVPFKPRWILPEIRALALAKTRTSWGDICRDVRKPEVLRKFPTQVPAPPVSDDPFNGGPGRMAAAVRAASVLRIPTPEARWAVLETVLMGARPAATVETNLNLLTLVRLVLSNASPGRPLVSFDDPAWVDSCLARVIPQELDAIRKVVDAIHAELKRIAIPASDGHI